MASPREHIEHIRKTTFSIGGEKNPLAPMLDQAVKYLSAELYTKDVHFLMELIQVFLSFLHFFIVLVLLNYLLVQ
jgi:sacsin